MEKVVVVAGGAGLLGKTFATELAGSGQIVFVADIDLEAAKAIARDVDSKNSGIVEAAYLDVTSKDSVCGLISRVRQEYGRVDAVVNCAYPRTKNYGRKLEDVTYEDFCKNVDTHLGGYFLVAQQFCLAFKEMGGGSVVNMSSIYGTMAPRFGVYSGTTMTMPVEYAAIKAGVIQLTRYFAQYYKADNIRVNCISPGGIRDGQPAGFLEKYDAHCASKGMLDADDVATSLLFLLSDGARYITGQNLVVDDGYSL